MTQEQKELLLKDLCARLPYGVKLQFNYVITSPAILKGINKDFIECDIAVCELEDIKPYLFPLSSMTEEQAKEMQEIVGSPKDACIMRKTGGLELWLDSVDTDPTIWLDTIFEVQDWLNKNHFDYRGLIEKGLAIDATNLNIY